MKTLLATTSIALLMSNAAFAEAHATAVMDYEFNAETDMMASDFLGSTIYSTEEEMENGATIADNAEVEWDNIGEINDIVMTHEGDVQAIILGVGGFLGMGEKDVAVDLSQIKMVVGEDGEGFLVINASQEMLENAQSFTREPEQQENAEMDESADMEETDSMDRPMMAAPMVERDGYMTASMDDLTTEDLTGASVYGSNDEDVGAISSLIVSDDGKIEEAILDIGGFLGMGEKSIAVTMDELTILRNDDGSDLRVFIDATQEALEAQPAYEN